MTIRKIDKNTGIYSKPKVGRGAKSGAAGGANFASTLDAVAGLPPVDAAERIHATEAVGEVDAVSDQERRRQLRDADDLLDSLEGLEKGLAEGGRGDGGDSARARLIETRDQALRTLSDSPRVGEERDLLNRTAVLAAVELAKSDRGDYN
ncbi:flagellar assembly protein FliX [Magnetofaba australis]|uniref:Flagellar assembly protein FliX n=1 Tax=Magnetofaba australis IT-1 TaxID=1434232 RepID=A0A1Y2K7F2_9PROT|nr:flagellar assembly protein FliX [Magnetofaba australis]OSM04302.1 hypothetical protein MAIT1_04177 [Magnetofaba australis IT-1]